MYMPNKTIYVSEEDISLFEEAKNIAGEGLSSVISKALKEFVSRSKKRQDGVREISVMVGPKSSEREQRFLGKEVGKWTGFDNGKEWYLSAKIYITQKNNWAVYLTTICRASLLTDKKSWKENGEYLINPKKSELLVAKTFNDLQTKVPQDLYTTVESIAEKETNPVEYLDI